jgi:hypothetical protein
MQIFDSFLESLEAIVRRDGDRVRDVTGIDQTANQSALRFAEIRILQSFVERTDQGGQPAGIRRAQRKQQFVRRYLHGVPAVSESCLQRCMFDASTGSEIPWEPLDRSVGEIAGPAADTVTGRPTLSGVCARARRVLGKNRCEPSRRVAAKPYNRRP